MVVIDIPVPWKAIPFGPLGPTEYIMFFYHVNSPCFALVYCSSATFTTRQLHLLGLLVLHTDGDLLILDYSHKSSTSAG